MTDNDKDETSNPADMKRPDEKIMHMDALAIPDANEQKNMRTDIDINVDAVDADETALLNREKLASSREDAAQIREDAARIREDAARIREDAAQIREDVENLRDDAAHLREEAVMLREQEIRSVKSISETSDDHMTMLQQANAHLVVATIEAQKLVEQVESSKNELAHLAYHDALTNLPNRMLLRDRLIQAIELAHRNNRQLAVIFLDLDRFKYINDSLGHAIGDKLLQSVAQRLEACVRHSDTISRQGGDEFVLLLPFIEHADFAEHCAKKILTALALPHSIDQHELQISVSIGISIYPDDGKDGDTLLKNGDIAMYCAKENGRNNFKFFEQEMNDRSVQRHTIEASLRSALERREFVLHYQPKVNLSSGLIVGVEALIRWQHPEQGLRRQQSVHCLD
jgi:diguanylate cyclase (GGDEF)-like protein